MEMGKAEMDGFFFKYNSSLEIVKTAIPSREKSNVIATNSHKIYKKRKIVIIEKNNKNV